MVHIKNWHRGLMALLLCCLMVVLAGTAVYGAEERDETQASENRTTLIELQSELMSFGDRFKSILVQAVLEVEAQTPDLEIRLHARRVAVASVSEAFIIAAGPNPEVGLLDMVVLTTLGRIINEKEWLAEFGVPTQPLVRAFKLLEKDIWLIAAKILTPKEQKELRSLIRNWRQQYPKQLIYFSIRFKDFSSERHEPGIKHTEEGSGLFKSVEQTTQKAEELLLLAERGIYLGSRMPLLSNAIVQMGLLEGLIQPQVKQLMADTNKMSDAIHRLANVAELKNEAFVNYTFIRIMMLILFVLLGSLLTGLIYQYVTRRVFITKKPGE